MDEALLAERKFPDETCFDWDWTEINYPIPKKQTQYPKPVRSVKFFTCFCVDFPLEPGPIFDSSNPDMYQKVEMIDPMGKNYEIFIEGSYIGRIFARHGLPEMVTYYDLRNEINYSKPLIKNEPTINEDDGLESEFFYATIKTLTDYDVHSSSLYLDFEFVARALVKNRKNHELRNTNGCSWSCTVRWAKKRTYVCFLSCGWKKFCAENGFQAGDVITFGVDRNRSTVINVRKD
ncbi:hypothetical protein DEO72_LG5g1094 [Vigna unguiculata]|uniref:TF-B3 domain-containing protein n=1 Tax=Vigna unguiculata TaxID=3917 RepID=A0A4D6LX11_VIGUN|nr:hypothetical protein DEO72_LG5g1094 [Vigna unguiculata]